MSKLYTLLLSLILTNISIAQVNMELQSEINYDVKLNDVWGYMDDQANEYALVGTRRSTIIENITDPQNPVRLGEFFGPESVWRDIKTYGKFAYVINETGSGLHVINLENLPNVLDSTAATFWAPLIPELGDSLQSCHNIYIDTETGYGYLSGCNLNSGGVIIIDLFTEPGNPKYVAAAAANYSHDVFVRDNLMYSSDIYAGSFSIQDISNLDSIYLINNQRTPFDFTHNTWLSDDSKTIFTTDERGGAPIGAYDISDMSSIKYLDEFRPISSLAGRPTPHNVHVLNDYLVSSYYSEGVIITDAHRPQNLIEVGNYDTTIPGSGVWGAFPFFDSGTVIGSDINSVVFVLKPTYVRASYLEGNVIDSLTRAPLQGVQVNILSSDPNLDRSDLNGDYKTGQVTPGSFEVTYAKEGYFPKTVTTNLATAEVTILDIELVKDTSFTSSIPELAGVEEFKIFPNPFTQTTTIQYALEDLPENTHLIINDLLGRNVQQQLLTQKSGNLTIGTDLQAGIYFVQLMADGAVSTPMKVVKRGN